MAAPLSWVSLFLAQHSPWAHLFLFVRPDCSLQHLKTNFDSTGALPDVFPLRLIWLTPVFTLIGGGEVTVLTMVYAMVADVSPAAQR